MGWFGGSSSDKKAEDPLDKLDPELRAYLIKESPVKYPEFTAEVTPRPKPIEEPPAAESTPAATSEDAAAAALEEGEASKVPGASLFQDGRYAHLWKNYRRQYDIEAEGKSDQEKMDDIIQGYKQRRSTIGKAALENCALEQWAVQDCYSNGKIASKITMCKAENRELTRCYEMQSKFLKALGYFSSYDDPKRDEKIQMHADTLYHRMLEQEKALEEAKAAGLPTPRFPSLFEAETAASTAAEWEKAAEKEKARLRTPEMNEAELVRRAALEEIRAGYQMRSGLSTIFDEKEAERLKRKEVGKETVPDQMVGAFGGWGSWFREKPREKPQEEPREE